MDAGFFRPRETSRFARGFFAAYTVLGVLLVAAALLRLEFPREWLWGFGLGFLAWAVERQGLTTVVEGWILSLEVGVYLWLFLVVGPWPGIPAILLTSSLSLAHGLVMRGSDRHIDFCFRKLANTFVLGSAYLAGVAAYRAVGGTAPLAGMGAVDIAAVVAFWITFTLVNNALFWPIDVSREGRFHGARLLRETVVDGAVHGLGVLAGSGFALLFNRMGVEPLLLLVPVFGLLVVFLKRVTEQEGRLKQQHSLLRKLNEKGAHLHRSLDFDEVLDAVGETVRDLFQSPVYFVALFDERTEKVQVARAVDHGKTLVLEDFDPSEGLTGLVLRTGKPLFSGDIVKDPRLAPSVRPVGDDVHLIHSVMLGPLVDKGRCIGVFSIQSKGVDAFKPFHQELFLAVLQQVSTAVVAARLYRRATEDGLTHLYNKSFLDDRIRACLAERKPFALLFLDCDDFKAINDHHGHPLGDRYLAALAHEIHESCRAGDVPCRYGGDEFALLLPGTNAEQAHRVAERVRQAVDELRLPVEGGDVGTTVSIGVLWSDGKAGTIPVEDVLGKVDRALYEAKRAKHDIVETVL